MKKTVLLIFTFLISFVYAQEFDVNYSYSKCAQDLDFKIDVSGLNSGDEFEYSIVYSTNGSAHKGSLTSNRSVVIKAAKAFQIEENGFFDYKVTIKNKSTEEIFFDKVFRVEKFKKITVSDVVVFGNTIKVRYLNNSGEALFSIDGENFQNSNVFRDLKPNTQYQVFVKDNCSQTSAEFTTDGELKVTLKQVYDCQAIDETGLLNFEFFINGIENSFTPSLLKFNEKLNTFEEYKVDFKLFRDNQEDVIFENIPNENNIYALRLTKGIAPLTNIFVPIPEFTKIEKLYLNSFYQSSELQKLGFDISGGKPPYKVVLADDSILELDENNQTKVLDFGSYDIKRIEDSSNCSVDVASTLTLTQIPSFQVLDTKLDYGCSTLPKLSVSITSSLTNEVTYLFKLIDLNDPNTNGEFVESSVFNIIKPSLYKVLILSSTNELVESKEIQVDQKDPIDFTLFVTNTGIDDGTGSVKIVPNDVYKGYQFSIDNNELTNTNVFYNLGSNTTHTVTVYKGECSESASFTVQKLDVDNRINVNGSIISLSTSEDYVIEWYYTADKDSGQWGRYEGDSKELKANQEGFYRALLSPKASSKFAQKSTTEEDKSIWTRIVEITKKSLSIDDVEFTIQDNIVYPNPATDVVYLPSNLIGKKYTIYSLVGAKLFSGVISEVAVNVEALPSGVYFIVLNNKKTIKIVKQ